MILQRGTPAPQKSLFEPEEAKDIAKLHHRIEFFLRHDFTVRLAAFSFQLDSKPGALNGAEFIGIRRAEKHLIGSIRQSIFKRAEMREKARAQGWVAGDFARRL